MKWVRRYGSSIVALVAFVCLGKVIVTLVYNAVNEVTPLLGIEDAIFSGTALFLFVTLAVCHKLAKHRLPEPQEPSKSIFDVK